MGDKGRRAPNGGMAINFYQIFIMLHWSTSDLLHCIVLLSDFYDGDDLKRSPYWSLR